MLTYLQIVDHNRKIIKKGKQILLIEKCDLVANLNICSCNDFVLLILQDMADFSLRHQIVLPFTEKQ